MPNTPPDRPGIASESLDILEHNTIAVLTGAPHRRDDWRAQLVQALEDTFARSPNDADEIALFRALLALVDGETPTPPDNDRYAEMLARIAAKVDDLRNDATATAGMLTPEQILTLVQGTAGVFAGEVDRDAWRAGLVHALEDARSRGEDWAREVELFGAFLALVDGSPPDQVLSMLATDHMHRQALQTAVDAASVGQDPTVAAMNAWLNAEKGEALLAAWREHEAILRDPEFLQNVVQFAGYAHTQMDDPAAVERIDARLALLRDCLARGEDALPS